MSIKQSVSLKRCPECWSQNFLESFGHIEICTKCGTNISSVTNEFYVYSHCECCHQNFNSILEPDMLESGMKPQYSGSFYVICPLCGTEEHDKSSVFFPKVKTQYFAIDVILIVLMAISLFLVLSFASKLVDF